VGFFPSRGRTRRRRRVGLVGDGRAGEGLLPSGGPTPLPLLVPEIAKTGFASFARISRFREPIRTEPVAIDAEGNELSKATSFVSIGRSVQKLWPFKF